MPTGAQWSNDCCGVTNFFFLRLDGWFWFCGDRISPYAVMCRSSSVVRPPIALYVSLINPWLPSTYFSGTVPWFTTEILGGRLDFMSPLQVRNFSNTGTLTQELTAPVVTSTRPSQAQFQHGCGGRYSRGPEVLLIIVS